MDTRRASLLLLLSFLSTHAQAYSFKFENTPSQCGTVSISITGSGGKAPYRLGIVPWGGSPLRGGQLEVRKILDLQFNDSSRISFTLPYPKNSQFIAIVSDNNGTDSNFASGGITVPVSITKSASDSCLPTKESQPPFIFSTDPVGSITTCQSSNLTWDGNTIGNVKFWGAIPGGNGFIITGKSVQDRGQQGIDWTPPISTGTGLIIIAGDDRGFGSGGSFQGFLQPGNGTTSCLNSNSPRATPGSPAGGSYPTDSSGHSTGGSNADIGAIVGGVVGGVGGVAIIGLLVFFLLRRRRRKRRIVGEPVDLLGGREGDNEDNMDIPQHYLPEPYHVPPSAPSAPTEMSETTTGLHPFSARDGRLSQLSVTTPTRLSSDETSTAPGQSTVTSAKSPAGPPPLRPVNIIQHEDAGPSEAPRNEEETVELPPAYTNIRK